MQVYGPASLHAPQAISAPHMTRATSAAQPTHFASAADEVQISSHAEFVSRMSDIPDIRQDRVDSLRAAIASGTYDTDAKLDLALERMLDELV